MLRGAIALATIHSLLVIRSDEFDTRSVAFLRAVDTTCTMKSHRIVTVNHDLNVSMSIHLGCIVLINFFGSPAMDSVFPALIKLGIFTTHAVVQNWRLLDRLESMS